LSKGFFFVMKVSTLLFAAFFILTLQSCYHPEPSEKDAYHSPHKMSDKAIVVKVPPPHDTLCITAVGDIMMGSSYPDNRNLPPDNGKESFKSVSNYLKNSDITFGNLEGTLLDEGVPAHRKLHFRSEAFLFRMPEKFGSVLKDAGFNVLSLANNHIGDFDVKGRSSTMHVLDSCDIKYAGLWSNPTSIFKIKGVTYGFCAFAPNGCTVSILSLKYASKVIQQLKQQCDVVIVAFHGGGEGTKFEHIPFKQELFVGEKRGDVYAFAHNAIDAGADIVLGTGPHVGRAMEVYNNRFIAYSLGNFCTYKNISVSGVCGIAPVLKLYINKKGEFLNGRIIAVKQTRQQGLETDSLNLAVKRIKMLTAVDFPHGKLKIGDNGMMTLN
jgi:hypothetical protein